MYPTLQGRPTQCTEFGKAEEPNTPKKLKAPQTPKPLNPDPTVEI